MPCAARRPACAARPTKRAVLPTRPLFEPGHAGRAVLGARRRVDHHRQVDVVEVAEAQQLALPPRNSSRPARTWSAATRGRRPPRRGRRRTPRARRGARTPSCATSPIAAPSMPGDLRVVTARVRRAGDRIGLGMAGDDEPVELAEQRERRSLSRRPATSARTPVNASPVRGVRPSPASVSSTSAAVFVSLKPSSGLRQIRSPMPIMSAARRSIASNSGPSCLASSLTSPAQSPRALSVGDDHAAPGGAGGGAPLPGTVSSARRRSHQRRSRGPLRVRTKGCG